MKVWSVIIPHINDTPHIWFTVHNMIEELRHEFWNQAEIIVIDNGSKPEPLRLLRRMMGDRNIKGFAHKLVVVNKQLHSKPALNIGAWMARGKYLAFFDSHCLCSRKFFEESKKFMDANPNVAILHSPISWYGYNPKEKGYQYKLHLDDRFWGGWRNHKVRNRPYPVAASGNTGMIVRKDFYLKVKGFPSMLRYYGGGEPYLDLLAWMFGYEAYLHPDLHCYHFAMCRARDYKRDSGIFFRNICLAAFICGGEKYSKPLLNQHVQRHPHLEKRYRELYAEALKFGSLRRRFVEENAKYTLDEALQLFKDRKIFH